MTVDILTQSATVLVVDDSPTNLQVLCDVLTKTGYRVAISKSGESALQRLQSFQPDIILLDVMMPGLDGFETCQRLKADLSTCDIPVIFVTALSESSQMVKGLSLGAVDYITKPIQHEEALARIQVHLQLHRCQMHFRRMAYEDYLTHLPNRTQLYEQLSSVLHRVRLSGESGALLLIDLDHFKTINDALGHDVGDEVLRAIARRLTQVVAEQAFIARLGGDEFVVLMTAATKQAAESDALEMAEKILEKLASPIFVGERTFNVGASIGAVIFAEDGLAERDVMRHADLSLYHAKRLGRGMIQFYHPSLQTAAINRLRLEEGLRRAIANDELELYFQPQVDTAGQMIGAEVLLRWHHPELGNIPPSTFIPVAEETGLIHRIGRWVLEQACIRLTHWLQIGMPFKGRLSVNVCAAQFACPDFVEQVRHVLTAYQIDPRYLALELTETALLHDVSEAIEKLTALRTLGLEVALDDFGTGYSSLAYLKNLPLDLIKIDKMFIKELETTPEHSLVESIVAIGKLMKLGVVAEGVETAMQHDILIQLGCSKFQGYFFSRPLPEPEFLEWIATDRAVIGY